MSRFAWINWLFIKKKILPPMKRQQGRDESNILASRDKHSVVRSFQASLKEDFKLSQQRSSKNKVHRNEEVGVQVKSKALGVPFDADKLAKDAGGMHTYILSYINTNSNIIYSFSGFRSF
jgi:hypothetical protein